MKPKHLTRRMLRQQARRDEASTGAGMEIVVSTPPKTKADFLAQIEEAKRANEARLEPLREFRRLADSLLSNPLTTPDVIAWIEQRQQDIQEMLEANKAVERQLADLFFEHDLDKLFAE